MRFVGAALAAGALLLATPTVAAAPQDAVPWVKAGPTVPLSIRAHGKVLRFQVEQALTPAEQEQGLMFRKSMPATHGMIFPMSPPRPQTFWMKNTYIGLDIIFIGADRRILQVSANAVPLSEAIVGCDGQVAAVLELNAGAAKKMGIKAGDKVSW